MSCPVRMHAAPPGQSERGFTLVELMVAVAISLFLLFGLATVVQNIRRANTSATALSMLQDQQRFAFEILTDVIQTGGYFPTPTLLTVGSLPAYTGPNGWESAAAGQAFFGAHPGGTSSDSLGVRYMTAGQDGVILCDGSTNTAPAGTIGYYANQFSVVAPTGTTPGYLQCQLNSGAAVPLVYGVTNMIIYYGVNRASPTSSYNIDTYLTADQMCSTCASNDWDNVSSVRVVLTFTNPLYNAAAPEGQSATITIERVVQVMGRGGLHS
jgi:type IV pilus assembly protein PilW